MPSRAELKAAAAGSHTIPAFYDLGFCPLPQEAPEDRHTHDIIPDDSLASSPTPAALEATNYLLADPAGQLDCSGPLDFEDILDGCPEPRGLDRAVAMLQQPMQQEDPAFSTMDGQLLGLSGPVPAPKHFSLPTSSMDPEHADFNLADHIIPELVLDDDIADYMSEGDDFAGFLRETFPEPTDNDTRTPLAHSGDLAGLPVMNPQPHDDRTLDSLAPTHDIAPAMGPWQKLLLEQPNSEPSNIQATQAVLPEQPTIGQPQTQATAAEAPEQPSRSRHQRPVGAWKAAPAPYPHYHLSHANPDYENQEDDQAPNSMHQVRLLPGILMSAGLVLPNSPGYS